MMKLETMAKHLERYRDKIAKDRDALRAFLDEAESLDETADRAVENLEAAIAALSEQA